MKRGLALKAATEWRNLPAQKLAIIIASHKI